MGVFHIFRSFSNLKCLKLLWISWVQMLCCLLCASQRLNLFFYLLFWGAITVFFFIVWLYHLCIFSFLLIKNICSRYFIYYVKKCKFQIYNCQINHPLEQQWPFLSQFYNVCWIQFFYMWGFHSTVSSPASSKYSDLRPQQNWPDWISQTWSLPAWLLWWLFSCCSLRVNIQHTPLQSSVFILFWMQAQFVTLWSKHWLC